jgi:hypothetical protein
VVHPDPVKSQHPFLRALTKSVPPPSMLINSIIATITAEIFVKLHVGSITGIIQAKKMGSPERIDNAGKVVN